MKEVCIQIHQTDGSTEHRQAVLEIMASLDEQNAGIMQSDVLEAHAEYTNVTLPAHFWPNIQVRLDRLGTKMIVVCQGQHGWSDYRLLHHYDASQSLPIFDDVDLGRASL